MINKSYLSIVLLFQRLWQTKLVVNLTLYYSNMLKNHKKEWTSNHCFRIVIFVFFFCFTAHALNVLSFDSAFISIKVVERLLSSQHVSARKLRYVVKSMPETQSKTKKITKMEEYQEKGFLNIS